MAFNPLNESDHINLARCIPFRTYPGSEFGNFISLIMNNKWNKLNKLMRTSEHFQALKKYNE